MTTGPIRSRSWVPVPSGSDFPLENLPYGVFESPDRGPRICVAIGESVLDLVEVGDAGLLDGLGLPADVFASSSLNRYLALAPEVWHHTRARLTDLLSEGNEEVLQTGLAERALVDRSQVTMRLPIDPGDYIDFYSSIEHATNVGAMFRPGAEPLLPNWRHLPVGYHGRTGTLVVDGTPITRPNGQQSGPDEAGPVFGPSRALDFELEVGFVTGGANRAGSPIAVNRAERHIFGLCLVNDWSARDIQAWEYRPLGPFLSKSFATTLSPWVVPLEALEPYRVDAPVQDPIPASYLRDSPRRTIDLHLTAAVNDTMVTRVDFSSMYWTMAQQLAHATVNGATARAGDLFASGTVSGADPGSLGCLLEATRNGARPIRLDDGSERRFLLDGDTVTIRGFCGGGELPRIGFGRCSGMVIPARRA